MKAVKTIIMIMVLTSCSIGGKELRPSETANQEAKRSTIDENIERAMLDPTAVSAFELQAVEKFKDLLDYIEVAKSKELDEILRLEAYKAVSTFFVSQAESKSIALTMAEKQNTIDQLYVDQKSIKEIIFSNPFRNLRPGIFAGEINYLPLKSIARKRVLVYLVRIEKNFGTEKHFVWEIKFGEVK